MIGEHQVIRGEKLFTQIACAKCHVQSFHTSVTPVARASQASSMPAALLNRDVRPYSDFLLHDMGATLNDGVSLGVAKP